MFKKVIGFSIRGFACKFGVLVYRLKPVTWLATVTGSHGYIAEKFSTQQDADHWAECIGQRLTRDSGQKTTITVSWLRGDEFGLVTKDEIQLVEVLQRSTAL